MAQNITMEEYLRMHQQPPVPIPRPAWTPPPAQPMGLGQLATQMPIRGQSLPTQMMESAPGMGVQQGRYQAALEALRALSGYNGGM